MLQKKRWVINCSNVASGRVKVGGAEKCLSLLPSKVCAINDPPRSISLRLGSQPVVGPIRDRT